MKQFNRPMAHASFRTGILAVFMVAGIAAHAQTTVAAWDGNGSSAAPFAPSSSHTTNNGARLTTNTTNPISTSVGGPEGQFYLSTGWDNGANTKSWTASIVTTGFTSIKVASKQRSTALGFMGWNGPGEFKLQYSLNNSTWVDVVTTINPRDNWTSANISNISLPVACENQANVYLRWVMRSNVATQTSPGSFGSQAQSYIDDIIISGTYNAAPANTAPVMQDAAIATDENTVLYIAPAINDNNPNVYFDADSNEATHVKVTALPTNGTLMFSTVAVVLNQEYLVTEFYQFSYVPNSNYTGTDAFSMVASDGTVYSANQANITVTVSPVNTPPVLEDLVITTNEDQPVAIANFATPTSYTDSDVLVALKIIQIPAHGNLVLDGQVLVNGAEILDADLDSLMYVPNANYNGGDSFVWNATDGTAYADSNAMAHITIAPANDAPADIALSSLSVDENSSIGSVVGTLSNTDVDAGDSHYYQLVNNALGNAYFTIDGDQLKVANNINFELTPQLNIEVMVVDLAGESFDKAFTISVNDKNDAPTALALSNTTIDEQQAAGAFVGILTAIDEDANETLTYALATGAGDADNSSFRIVNNVLVTDALLDYNTQQQYIIRISAGDVAGASVEQVFVINLTDVNQAPSAIAISNATIQENNTIGALIGTFSSTDADAGDSHTYTLVSGAGADDNASFQINQDGLEAAVSFDFETKSSYSIRVSATDAAGASHEEVLTISILDAADAPTGITLSNTSVDENVAIGTLIGNLSTTVVDQTSGHTYTFVTGTGDADNGSFSISSGHLYTAAPINFEVKDSYSIRVRSTDGQGGFAEETFTIGVNDINEAPTAVTVTVMGINEDAPVGLTAAFINAIDEDLSDTHVFTFANGLGDADNGKFTIDANKLQVNAALDFETQSSMAVRLRATDAGGEFVEKNFTLAITNVNEAPTALTLSANTIAENGQAGAMVGTLSIADQDQGDSHDFGFATGNGDDDNASFHISGNMLFANASFNFEDQSSYSIRVAGTDMGGLKVEEVFTITILDVADAPVMANISKQVYKNVNTKFISREFTHVYSQEEGNAITHIQIMSLPTSGELLHYNAPVAVGDKILVSEISSLSYNPMFGYLGADAFTFNGFDGVLHSADATYSLTVINGRVVGTAATQLNPGHFGLLSPAGGTGNREGDMTSIGEEMPIEVTAFSNYPNPFNGATTINFELPVSMKVTLEVYDLLGRKVASLVDGEELNGKHSFQWKGGEAGQYIAQLVATDANGAVVIKTINLMQVK